MLLTEVAVSALIMTFIPFKLGILLTVAMLFLINLLFAANYNMIVIEDLLKKRICTIRLYIIQYINKKRNIL